MLPSKPPLTLAYQLKTDERYQYILESSTVKEEGHYKKELALLVVYYVVFNPCYLVPLEFRVGSLWIPWQKVDSLY